MQSTIDRFDLMEAVAERIFVRMSSQVAGLAVDHDAWTVAYEIFKSGSHGVPMVELSFDLAKEVLSLVDAHPVERRDLTNPS